MITDVVSFGGNTFDPDEYEVGFVTGTQPRLPEAQVSVLDRLGGYPVIAGLSRKSNKLSLMINIVDTGNVDALRAQLFNWFDPDDETPKKLVVNSTGGVQLYVYALTEELRLYSTPRYQQAFVATLVVDGEARWSTDAQETDTWNIVASGETRTITNSGEIDAYPVYRIKPTSSKTGGYDYQRHVHILWKAAGRGSQYPIAITLATDALVGAGKMQADGDDLRVYIDGVETYRWLDAMNTAATKIWFNGEWMPTQAGTLKTGIAGAGSVTSVELNEDISGWPEAGALYIGSEAFTYTARDLELMKLTGVTRAARGTSAAMHAIGAAVTWLQHDVTIAYGNATASAPTTDNNYRPTFELDHSTNTSWVYEVFGDSGGRRAARWINVGTISPAGGIINGVYTGHYFAFASPYTVLGALILYLVPQAYGWTLSNPCGIVNAEWSNGEKIMLPGAADFVAHCRHWVRGTAYWTNHYTLAVPAAFSAWEAWSYSGAAFDVSDTIALTLYFHAGAIEAGDVTVTLNSSETPTITVGGEGGNYTLACTLTNTTTGDAIQVNFDMALNETIEIDTYNKTVTYLADNSNQFQALTLVGGVRGDWLPLQPGANVLQFDDTGTAAVTVTTVWRERYY